MMVRWQPKLRAATAAAVIGLLLCALALGRPTFSLGADRGSGPVPRPVVVPRDLLYLRQSAAAMEAMMQDMQRPPTGDVDRDFVAQMVPHHEGAIRMAVALLSSTHNAQLRRLAEEIIVTQREEIVAMQLAISEPGLTAPGQR